MRTTGATQESKENNEILFSYTHFSDGQRIFLGKPQITSTKSDGYGYHEGYQYFFVYDDEYLENKIGSIGISMSGTVSSIWSFDEGEDARKKLSGIMRLALPFINLPISPEQYSSIPPSYFPVIQLHSGGDTFYDEKNRIVHIPSGSTPEDFFKSTVFGGNMGEKEVSQAILTHGYLEGHKDPTGDFNFLTINLTLEMWPINPSRISKAYRSLTEDGLLEESGKLTSTGFPSFSKIPSAVRREIEGINPVPNFTNREIKVEKVYDQKNLPYIPQDLIEKLVKAAKKNDYDTKKLEAILSELNDATEQSKAQSSHSLIRALLDHIAPLFGYDTFTQTANNYTWSRTDKKRINELNTLFRFDADQSLHAPISKNNTAVDMHSIGVIRSTINGILEQAVKAS